MRPVVRSAVRVHVEGTANLDGLPQRFVVASNHSSHLDTPLIFCSLPRRRARYLAVGAAADYFFDVWWRRGLTTLFFNAFPVERTGMRARPMDPVELLHDGVPILLFPEGTRSRTGEIGEFRYGTAALCVSTGAPCVPLAVVGAYDAMPRGRGWPERGRPPVSVHVGEPLYPQPDEDVARFSQRIEDRIRSLHRDGTARKERSRWRP